MVFNSPKMSVEQLVEQLPEPTPAKIPERVAKLHAELLGIPFQPTSDDAQTASLSSPKTPVINVDVLATELADPYVPASKRTEKRTLVEQLEDLRGKSSEDHQRTHKHVRNDCKIVDNAVSRVSVNKNHIVIRTT